MKKLHKLTLALIIVLACSFSLQAQKQEFTFIWKPASSGSYSLKIRATAGEKFTIKWGNGTPAQDFIAAGEDTDVDVSSNFTAATIYKIEVKAKKVACKFLRIDFSGSSDSDMNMLDVSNLVDLTYLNCANNLLTTLDVSTLTNLKELYCQKNSLLTLNLGAITTVEQLDCSENQLASLDVSNLTNLKDLYCYKNSLTALNLGSVTTIENFDCSKNDLTSLDVSNLNNLKDLSCDENKIDNLVINSLVLETLSCYENKLTSLSLTNLSNFKSLACNYNELSSLDLTGLLNLDFLNCSNNKLTSLDVSNHPKLKELDCSKNLLTSLTLGSSDLLKKLYCIENALSLDNLDNVSKQMQTNAGTAYLGTQTRAPKYLAPHVEIIPDGIKNVYNDGSSDQNSDYYMKKDGTPCLTPIDPNFLSTTFNDIYKLKFTAAGTYEASFTNGAIISDASAPAKVIDTYIVENVHLSGITVTSGKLSPSFDPNVLSYTVTVLYSVASINLDATAAIGITVGGDIGNNKALIVGNNVFNISATSPKGAVQTYTVTIIRRTLPPTSPSKSNDATLKELVIEGVTLSPVFSPAVLSYSANVLNKDSVIKVTASANSSLATVDFRFTPAAVTKSISKTYPISVGKNTLEVVVTAENGTQNIYKIDITRAGLEMGVDELNAETVKIYPTLTSGKVYIQSANEAAPRVDVYSISGKLIQRVFATEVDLSTCPNGIYILQIGNKKVKVVKQ